MKYIEVIIAMGLTALLGVVALNITNTATKTTSTFVQQNKVLTYQQQIHNFLISPNTADEFRVQTGCEPFGLETITTPALPLVGDANICLQAYSLGGFVNEENNYVPFNYVISGLNNISGEQVFFYEHSHTPNT